MVDVGGKMIWNLNTALELQSGMNRMQSKLKMMKVLWRVTSSWLERGSEVTCRHPKPSETVSDIKVEKKCQEHYDVYAKSSLQNLV